MKYDITSNPAIANAASKPGILHFPSCGGEAIGEAEGEGEITGDGDNTGEGLIAGVGVGEGVSLIEGVGLIKVSG